MLEQQTKERTGQDRTATAPAPTSGRRLTVVLAVMALALLAVGAWALVERGRADDLSADLAAATAELDAVGPESVVVADGAALTDRQQEMVEFIRGPFIDAWRAADGDAVAGLYVPDGIQYDIAGDRVLTSADGSLQAFASAWRGIDLRPGVFVHGDRVVFVLHLAGREVGGIVEFTSSGDLLVESAAMYDSALER